MNGRCSPRQARCNLIHLKVSHLGAARAFAACRNLNYKTNVKQILFFFKRLPGRWFVQVSEL